MALKAFRILFGSLSLIALLSFSLFAQQIGLVGEDQKTVVVDYKAPRISLEIESSKSPAKKILSWDENPQDFLLAVAAEIRGVFESSGNDHVLELLKLYAEFSLPREKLLEGLKALQATYPSMKEKLLIVLPAHSHSAPAIEFLNNSLERAGFPLFYKHEINDQLPDPYKLSASGSVRAWERARLLTGPAVVGLGVATGSAPLDIPLAAVTAQQVGYELQFGKKEINSRVWKPLWQWGDRQKILRILSLGMNPAILGVNLLYPISLYESRLTLIHQFGGDPTVLPDRAVQYPLFVLGALIFSSSYGIFQSDLVHQQVTGRRSADSWFVNESILNMTANSLRIGTIFFPIVLATAEIFGVHYNIDVGTAGLVALAAAAIPNRIKTRVAPKVRAAYVRDLMERNSKPSSIVGFKSKCLAMMDRLSNFYTLTR